jgi:hypothetical protein
LAAEDLRNLGSDALQIPRCQLGKGSGEIAAGIGHSDAEARELKCGPTGQGTIHQDTCSLQKDEPHHGAVGRISV